MINNKHLGGEWIAPAEFAEVQHRDFATAAHMEAICGNAGHIGQCQPLLDYSCKDVSHATPLTSKHKNNSTYVCAKWKDPHEKLKYSIKVYL